MLTKEFLSIYASSSPSEQLFFTSRGIITFRRRRRLAPNTIYALMTLKSWSCEDATRDDEIDLEVEESRFRSCELIVR